MRESTLTWSFSYISAYEPNDIISKIMSLPAEKQREVLHFVDHLLQEEKSHFDLTAWQKRIQRVGVWTNSDLDKIEEVGSSIDGLRPEVWS